jgi:hypothetical protein
MCANSVHGWDKKFSKRNRRKLYKRRMTKHHLLAKSRGGSSKPSNLLRIYSDKHEAFNTLFGSSATIDEAIAILYRIKRAKKL